MPERLWVVIPAFNEATVIGDTLKSLLETTAKIVVVDDGSSDSTSKIAACFGVCVVRHAINLGQGAAIQTGITFALAQGATHICTFDADGQHDPNSIESMVSSLRRNGAGVALGSRFLDRPIGMPLSKRLILKAALVLTRAQTQLDITDTHNGLRLFTRESAVGLRLRQNGMAHASELLQFISRTKIKYVEVPTTVRYTSYSRAKGQPWTNAFKILFDMCYAALTN